MSSRHDGESQDRLDPSYDDTAIPSPTPSPDSEVSESVGLFAFLFISNWYRSFVILRYLFSVEIEVKSWCLHCSRFLTFAIAVEAPT
jgi:hypothetical protein